MALGVHPLVQHADDAYAVIGPYIENRVAGVFEAEIARPQMLDRPSKLWELGEADETLFEPEQVGIRLLHAELPDE